MLHWCCPGHTPAVTSLTTLDCFLSKDFSFFFLFVYSKLTGVKRSNWARLITITGWFSWSVNDLIMTSHIHYKANFFDAYTYVRTLYLFRNYLTSKHKTWYDWSPHRYDDAMIESQSKIIFQKLLFMTDETHFELKSKPALDLPT